MKVILLYMTVILPHVQWYSQSPTQIMDSKFATEHDDAVMDEKYHVAHVESPIQPRRPNIRAYAEASVCYPDPCWSNAMMAWPTDDSIGSTSWFCCPTTDEHWDVGSLGCNEHRTRFEVPTHTASKKGRRAKLEVRSHNKLSLDVRYLARLSCYIVKSHW
jgi:hypothetical protein